MLTLTAIAIFPIALVSYVIVRDEVRNVTRTIDFEVHDAAQNAQARFARSRDRGQVRAVATATSPRLQAAVSDHDTKTLEQIARRGDLLLQVDGHTYGRRLSDAVRTRVQLVSQDGGIGWVVAQVPLDAATVRRLSAGAADGVQLVYVHPSGSQSLPSGRGVTQPLTKQVGVRAYLPSAIEEHRKNAAYLRVAEAGLLALAALMILTLVLTRPLLRAFRWTEEQATEARIDALTASPISSPSCCSTSTASRRSTTPSATPPAT